MNENSNAQKLSLKQRVKQNSDILCLITSILSFIISAINIVAYMVLSHQQINIAKIQNEIYNKQTTMTENENMPSFTSYRSKLSEPLYDEKSNIEAQYEYQIINSGGAISNSILRIVPTYEVQLIFSRNTSITYSFDLGDSFIETSATYNATNKEFLIHCVDDNSDQELFTYLRENLAKDLGLDDTIIVASVPAYFIRIDYTDIYNNKHQDQFELFYNSMVQLSEYYINDLEYINNGTIYFNNSVEKNYNIIYNRIKQDNLKDYINKVDISIVDEINTLKNN